MQTQLTPNELRLGNWIVNKWLDSRINQWYDEFVRVDIRILETIEAGYYPDTDKWEGIPLTLDLVEKCGFMKAEDPYYRHILELKIAPSYLFFFRDIPNYGTILGIHDTFNENDVQLFDGEKIQYLHQLQNLYFALTGRELEINL